MVLAVESSRMTIALTDLQFTWPGADRPTLNVAGFNVAAGERVLLRGPSGCGKSTLLAALAGVIEVPNGAVKIAGQDVGALPASKRDAVRVDHIGMIFQVFNLIPWLSVTDNVVHDDKKICRAARAVPSALSRS